MAHAAPAARALPEAGQVFEEMAKSVVSLSVIAPMMMPVLPLLAIVTLLTATGGILQLIAESHGRAGYQRWRCRCLAVSRRWRR